MVPKGYLWLARIASLLSLFALGFVITQIDPEKNWQSKAFFYAAFFFSVWGASHLFFLRLRRKNMRGEMLGENIMLSFRQSMLAAVLATGLLFFHGLRMLVWWDGLLVVAGIFLVELYFLSRD